MARDAPAAGGPPREAEPLYALPPARFVAERNALAKALAARDPEAAAAVRRLARPVGLAWVLNRLARERPDEVKALLSAGERLRAGQRQAIAGRGAAAFREADEALREAARALRSAAGPIVAGGGQAVPGTRLAHLELLLRVAAVGDPATRDALRRGVLGREPDVAAGGFGPAGLGGLAAVPEAVPAAEQSPAAGRLGAGRAGRERPAPERAGGAAEREAERPSAAAARREAAREAALARARDAEARARRDRERAVAAAERALRAAEKAHAAAARDAARRRAEADAAAGRAREAEARLAAAAREVEARRAALGRAAGG